MWSDMESKMVFDEQMNALIEYAHYLVLHDFSFHLMPISKEKFSDIFSKACVYLPHTVTMKIFPNTQRFVFCFENIEFVMLYEDGNYFIEFNLKGVLHYEQKRN